MSTAAILTLNVGSSSVKFALFAADGSTRLAQGEATGLGGAACLRTSRRGEPAVTQDLAAGSDAFGAIDAALEWLDAACSDVSVAVVGHRIVHGGTRFVAPLAATAEVLQELEALDPLAPKHQPFNIAGVRRVQARYPHSRAVACFDTAFHAGWDDATARLAIPRRFHDAGVRRYGFHGLSYEFLAARLGRDAPHARRAVLAHLGSGASLCALRDGRSIDCTMGFSTLDGLPMATRSGTIDPGVIFHLQRQYGLGFDAIEHLLYDDSGLKGVSGRSGDMRELLDAGDAASNEAVALFVQRCVREIGAMVAVLGGVDALVFSGGIGAHAAPVRTAICARLGAFGVVLDAAGNQDGAGRISAPASAVPVYAWATDEEAVIAAHCAAWTSRGTL